jgi:hypothetical protein
MCFAGTGLELAGLYEVMKADRGRPSSCQVLTRGDLNPVVVKDLEEEEAKIWLDKLQECVVMRGRRMPQKLTEIFAVFLSNKQDLVTELESRGEKDLAEEVNNDNHWEVSVERKKNNETRGTECLGERKKRMKPLAPRV